MSCWGSFNHSAHSTPDRRIKQEPRRLLSRGGLLNLDVVLEDPGVFPALANAGRHRGAGLCEGKNWGRVRVSFAYPSVYILSLYIRHKRSPSHLADLSQGKGGGEDDVVEGGAGLRKEGPQHRRAERQGEAVDWPDEAALNVGEELGEEVGGVGVGDGERARHDLLVELGAGLAGQAECR